MPDTHTDAGRTIHERVGSLEQDMAVAKSNILRN